MDKKEKFYTEIFEYETTDGKRYGFKVWENPEKTILTYSDKGFGSKAEAEININTVVGWLQGG